MKSLIKVFFLLSISLSLYSCADDVLSEANKPGFSDNGKVLDSLKKVYNCESVSYYNWDDKKPVDSCLTVCFINSKNVPAWDTLKKNTDKYLEEIKGIATVINYSLSAPQNYKSLQVIFLETDRLGGQEIQIPKVGMQFLKTEL